MGNKEPRKMKRVSVWLDQEEYNKLRAYLLLQGKGMTASEWIRSVVRSFNAKQQQL